MKFTRVRINNFYNLKDVELDLTEGLALIVGPNGSGKSNMIKCIDFLVKRILGRGSTNAKIWDVNASESFIEVNAVLCKAEVELFSNLRLWYLFCDMCDIIILIIAALKDQVLGHDLTSSKGTLSFLVHKFHQDSVFCDLPKETLRALFQKGSVGEIKNGNFNFASNLSITDWRDPCVVPFIQETFDKLFPKLLKITQETVASGRCRPKMGSDIFMWVGTADPGTGSDLTHFYNIKSDVWLPTTPEMESEAIWSSFREVFGDLNGMVFNLKGYAGQSENTSLQRMISNLVNLKHFSSPHLTCYGKNEEQWNTKLDDNKKERLTIMPPDILRWLSRCLQGRGEVDKICSTGRRSFVEEMAKKFLESSLCILPQNRGLFGAGSGVSLDLNKVEKMLVQSSLSSDKQKQKQYKSVVDALKSFCDLDVHVREEHFHQTCEENAQAIKELGDNLLNSHGTSSLGVGKRLSKLAEKIAKQSQSLTSSLQVLVTRTMQCEDSPYSITTQLTDLSGGEIEILMVLCAVHLSGADTVLLDEPGHSLHPPMQAQLRRWLETQRPSDQACVVVSHALEFISPQSLHCLYHTSSVGSGFTPFRLRLDGEAKPSDKVKVSTSTSVQATETLDPSHDKTISEKETGSVSNGEQTPGPSGIGVSQSVVNKAQTPESSDDNTAFDVIEASAAMVETFSIIVGSASRNNEMSKMKAKHKSLSEEIVQAPVSEVTISQESMTMLMQPDIRKMFFATGLYLVEGETDKRVLSAVRHIFMEEASAKLKTSKDLRELQQALKVQELDRWDILTLGGCGDAVKAYKAATELQIPCAVVLDYDAITVKHGRQVQPFNEANWKKSKLFKGLEKEKDSLPVAETLLTKVENIFEEGTPGKVSQNTRDVLKKHGFFIWEDDLEAVICDNPTMRMKVQEMKNFMEVVGESCPYSSSHEGRKPMSVEEAQDNYDTKVLAVLRPLATDLVDELDGARERIAESPQEAVTEKAQELITQISKKKQLLSNHDKFVTKGTKGKGKRSLKRADGAPTSSSKESVPGQQDIPGVESATAEDVESSKDPVTGQQDTETAKVEESSFPSEAPTGSIDEPVARQQDTSGVESGTAEVVEPSFPSEVPTGSIDEPVARQQHTSGVESGTAEVVEPSFPSFPLSQQQVTPGFEDGASTGRKQFRTEAQERLSWDRVKRKLHDGGWTRMPWETLIEVVRVCLQSEPSPLADLYRFMKQTQCKGKKRKREFPQNLLSRILSSPDDDMYD